MKLLFTAQTSHIILHIASYAPAGLLYQNEMIRTEPLVSA